MTIIVLVVSNVFWIASAGYWFLRYCEDHNRSRQYQHNRDMLARKWERVYEGSR